MKKSALAISIILAVLSVFLTACGRSNEQMQQEKLAQDKEALFKSGAAAFDDAKSKYIPVGSAPKQDGEKH